MSAEHSPKVVRSYRLVFRRRWRVFRLQNWRIPLPNGLELRAVGYWLCALIAIAVLGRLPLVGALFAAAPASLRFVALPIAAAWALSKWEIDGRSPHRAVFGILAWRLRPRILAGLRRCPAQGSVPGTLEHLAVAPDLRGASYPRGRLVGPARVLLRYPARVKLEGAGVRGRARSERMATARRWRITQAGSSPLHQGKTLEIPAGRVVTFD
jgi:hypothetical protein